MISSYVGENKEFERQYLARRARGRILPAGHARRALPRGRRGHSRLLHQDRRRHAGRRGQGSEGCSTARTYILERGIRADLSIIKGWKADESGNLIFRKTARNFNQPMATAGKICVAEVEEIVPVGSLDPDCIHLPSIYVKRLILGAPYDKKIEFRMTREREAA